MNGDHPPSLEMRAFQDIKTELLEARKVVDHLQKEADMAEAVHHPVQTILLNAGIHAFMAAGMALAGGFIWMFTTPLSTSMGNSIVIVFFGSFFVGGVFLGGFILSLFIQGILFCFRCITNASAKK